MAAGRSPVCFCCSSRRGGHYGRVLQCGCHASLGSSMLQYLPAQLPACICRRRCLLAHPAKARSKIVLKGQSCARGITTSPFQQPFLGSSTSSCCCFAECCALKEFHHPHFCAILVILALCIQERCSRASMFASQHLCQHSSSAENTAISSRLGAQQSALEKPPRQRRDRAAHLQLWQVDLCLAQLERQRLPSLQDCNNLQQDITLSTNNASVQPLLLTGSPLLAYSDCQWQSRSHALPWNCLWSPGIQLLK